MGGAVFGALGGAYGGTAFGSSTAGKILLTFATTGLGGTAAYSAAKRGDYGLAVFYTAATIGTAFLSYLSITSTATAGSAGAGAPSGPLPARYAFLRSINPSGSNTNCAACAAAVDDVLAGGKVKPASDSGLTRLDEISAGSGGSWQSAGGTLSGIISQFQGFGPGTRGLVVGGFNDTQIPGHVFNIENYNGVVYLLDGQTGGIPSTAGFDYFIFLRTN